MTQGCTVRAGILLVLTLVTIGAAPAVFGQEWSGCSNDLDSLRRRASDASSNANDADATHQKIQIS